MKSHQKIIREKIEKEEKAKGIIRPKTNIADAICMPISFQEAKSIILKYEYLGTMATGHIQAFGIFYNGVLSGAICFTKFPNTGAQYAILGKDNAHLVCVLARGACTYWAHEHSASKLIAFGTKWMAKNTQYKVFVAYTDPQAHEIGIIYQACNWLYTGKTVSKKEYLINGNWIGGQGYRKRKKETPDLIVEAIRPGSTKGRYILIQEKKETKKYLLGLLKFPIFPYPKREDLVLKFIASESDLNKKNVIYKITNLINNKIYIGQTIQKIKERYHKLDLTNPTVSGNALYNAALKYGNNNFLLEVIYESNKQTETEIIKDLNEKEEFYIKNTKSKNTSYNISWGGNNKYKTEEEKNKISNTHSLLKSKLYCLISPKGDKVEVFNLSKFCKENKLDYRGTYDVCNGKSYSHKGWRLWKSDLGAYSKKESVERNMLGSVKTYHLKKDDIVTKVTNLSKFSKDNILCYSNMKALVQNRIKSYRGWTVI